MCSRRRRKRDSKMAALGDFLSGSGKRSIFGDTDHTAEANK